MFAARGTVATDLKPLGPKFHLPAKGRREGPRKRPVVSIRRGGGRGAAGLANPLASPILGGAREKNSAPSDPERGEEAETEAASQEERPLGDGQELASEVKLVSIPQTEVPVLPAPGEARRSTVSRSSVASQVSRIESRRLRTRMPTWLGLPVKERIRRKEEGEAPRTPNSRSPTPVTPDERRRKSRRITFSATGPEAIFELVKKMFANPAPDPSKRQSKKRSREKHRSSVDSRTSDARSSVGPEAMTERARRLCQSLSGEEFQTSQSSAPLLATPGRFRYRTKGPFHDPWASLPPRRSSPSRSKLPPPPSQPPPV
eukprot:g23825.t1